MGAPVTLVSAGNQANPAGAPYSAANPLPVASYSSSGTENTALPPGRAAAASSVPVVLSTEDKAALDAASGVYTNAVAYAGATTAGKAIAVRMSVAGSVTVTFSGGGTMIVDVPIGTTQLPYAATNVVVATGTLTTAYKLT